MTRHPGSLCNDAVNISRPPWIVLGDSAGVTVTATVASVTPADEEVDRVHTHRRDDRERPHRRHGENRGPAHRAHPQLDAHDGRHCDHHHRQRRPRPPPHAGRRHRPARHGGRYQLQVDAGDIRRGAGRHTLTKARSFSSRPGPDAVDLAQLVDAREPAVGAAPRHDRFRHDGTDAGQVVELLLRRGVQINGSRCPSTFSVAGRTLLRQPGRRADQVLKR